jgi:hypothetical protein
MGGMVETHMKKIPDGMGRQEAFRGKRKIQTTCNRGKGSLY